MKLCKLCVVLIFLLLGIGVQAQDSILHFILCSDLHFGLTKNKFRGDTAVPAYLVNAAMAAQMNELSGKTIPNDFGVAANQKINAISDIIITGDIANRQEDGIQAASVSWRQFEKYFVQQIRTRDEKKNISAIHVIPGNHDVSNTVGFHRTLTPLKDSSSMIGMYQMMNQKQALKNSEAFSFNNKKIHYSFDRKGIHFSLLQLWPDQEELDWLTNDLKTVANNQPVFLFAHSYPDVEARFFTNPNGDHSINERDKFENLLPEIFKDGKFVKDTALIEQIALANFVKAHENIKAYFHGHTNYTEFYDWTGPQNNILLKCIRVDSPMKGKYSAKDETKLSFELISINTNTKICTVREILWNAIPNSRNPAQWGLMNSFSLQ